MSPFRRKERGQVSESRATTPLGPGLRIRSAQDLPGRLDILKRMIRGYREPKYMHLPPYVETGWTWNGPHGEQPETVVSFRDRDDDVTFMAFWPDGYLGIFPLGEDYHRRYLAVADDWERFDASHMRYGMLQSGLISLITPPIPRQFFVDALALTRFPPTEFNIAKVAANLGLMLTLDARSFIGTRNQAAAERFVSRHTLEHFLNKFPEGPVDQFPYWIMSDLAAWSPEFLPYLQELPARRRAILVDPAGADTPFWRQLEQAD